MGLASFSLCADNEASSLSAVKHEIIRYLKLFQSDHERVWNAFQAAMFLANEAWLLNPIPGEPFDRNLDVYYDLGADAQKPFIRPGGPVMISVLLGIFPAGLFAMALYSALHACWTGQLDSFAMMRIGAAMADDVPLRLVNDVNAVNVLDRTPGRIGDASDEEEKIGDIGIGGDRSFKCKRRYHSYASE